MRICSPGLTHELAVGAGQQGFVLAGRPAGSNRAPRCISLFICSCEETDDANAKRDEHEHVERAVVAHRRTLTAHFL
jgi:hypothetical protein